MQGCVLNGLDLDFCSGHIVNINLWRERIGIGAEVERPPA
jgi:hypothetical protein